jgi:hypothetical protein
LLGLAVAGGIHFLGPGIAPDGWTEAPFTLFCIICGMLMERSIHYTLGW